MISGGFYYYGTLIKNNDPEMISIIDASMFGGFSSGKDCAGVARSDPNAKVILDRFASDAILEFPKSACFGILPPVNLYEFKETILR